MIGAIAQSRLPHHKANIRVNCCGASIEFLARNLSFAIPNPDELRPELFPFAVLQQLLCR